MRRNFQVNGTVPALIFMAVGILGVIGWVMNIVTIAGSEFTVINGMLVLRLIGVFMAPLGAVLGWL